MPDTQVVPETKALLLSAGKKMLVIGANDTNIAQYRAKGDDRCQFMSVGEVSQTKNFVGNNIEIVVINGRIPAEALQRSETLADRAGVPTIHHVSGTADILRMAEKFAWRSKANISFELPGVTKTVESKPRVGTNGSGGPKPPMKTEPAAPPPKPPDQPPPPTLSELHDSFEQLYDQFGGDHKKVVAHYRSFGFGEDVITTGALYQRCLTIRKRRGEAPRRGQKQQAEIPTHLFSSEIGRKLVDAIANLRQAQELVLTLAAGVAAENERLISALTQQAEQLKDLPALKVEVADLRNKADQVLQMFGK